MTPERTFSPPETQPSNNPITLAEILDYPQGNVLQRAVKAWIRPYNPEGTVQLLEKLHIDDLQQLPISLAKKLRPQAYSGFHHQTSYTLGDPSVDSLVEMAAVGLTFNELVHLIQVPLQFVNLLIFASRHEVLGSLISGAAVSINVLLALVQRYARARLSLTIDRRLRRGKEFEGFSYDNTLNLPSSWKLKMKRELRSVEAARVKRKERRSVP